MSGTTNPMRQWFVRPLARPGQADLLEIRSVADVINVTTDKAIIQQWIDRGSMEPVIDLSETWEGRSCDTTIYADGVRILGPVVARGRVIRIHARWIEGQGIGTQAANGGTAPVPALLDVSGAAGAAPDMNRPESQRFLCAGSCHGSTQPGSRPRAADGIAHFRSLYESDRRDGEPGSHGQDGCTGAPGAAGHDGGEIHLVTNDLRGTLSLVACGGDGGRGYDGARGQDGQDGGNGAHDVWRSGMYLATCGSRGGRGGDAGAPGLGGLGGAAGAGGIVTVHSARFETDAAGVRRVTASATAGKAGSMGADCSVAASPGKGGSNFYGDHDGRGPSRQPDGIVRGKPSRPSSAPPTVKDGETRLLPLGTADLAAAADAGFVNLYVQKIKQLQLISSLAPSHENSESLLGAVRWIDAVLGAWLSQPGNVVDHQPKDPEIRSAFTDLQLLKYDLSSNLQAFGYQSDYVPLDGSSSYLALFRDSVAAYRNIETKYVEYLKADTADQKQLRASIDEYIHDGTTIRVLEAERGKLLADLRALLVQIMSIEKRIPDEWDAFTAKLGSAVNTLSGEFGASLEDIFQAIMTICMVPPVVSEGGKFTAHGAGVVLSAAEVGSLVGKWAGNLRTDGGTVVSKDHVIRQLTRFQGKFRDLLTFAKQARDSGAFEDDQNGAKALATADEIEAILDDFSSRAKVREAITELHAVKELVLARNEALLRYNTSLAQLVKMDGQQSDLEAHRKLVDEKIAEATQNFDNFILRTYLERLYQLQRDSCVRSLYLYFRAAGFEHLVLPSDVVAAIRPLLAKEALPAPFSPDCLEALRTAFEQVVQGTREEIEKRHALTLFPQGSEVVHRVVIERATAGAAAVFSRLDRSRETFIQFALPSKAGAKGIALRTFDGTANVRIANVRVWLRGLRTQAPTVKVRITHGGTEEVRRADGLVLHCAHPMKVGAFEYRPETAMTPAERPEESQWGDSSALDSGRIGPFTTWTLAVQPPETGPSAANEDLKDVDAIVVEFRGSFQTI